jgi:hypothetical protein
MPNIADITNAATIGNNMHPKMSDEFLLRKDLIVSVIFIAFSGLKRMTIFSEVQSPV